MSGRKQSVVSRRGIPRTTNVSGTGLCGHEYVQRTPVPGFLVGRERDANTLAKLEAWKLGVAADYAKMECFSCVAERSLADTRLTMRAIATWLGREPLPELSGSVKLVSFAERVRLGFLLRFLEADLANALSWAMGVPPNLAARAHTSTPAHSLLGDALRARWPGEKWLSGRYGNEGSPAGQVLLHRLVGAGFDSFELSLIRQMCDTPQRALLGWIALRRAWPIDPYHIFVSEDRPKVWIARQRSRRGLGLGAAEYQGTDVKYWAPSVFADYLIYSLGFWKTPEDAWNAWRVLSDPMGSDRLLAGVLEGSPDLGLEELLLTVSVMGALGASASAGNRVLV